MTRDERFKRLDEAREWVQQAFERKQDAEFFVLEVMIESLYTNVDHVLQVKKLAERESEKLDAEREFHRAILEVTQAAAECVGIDFSDIVTEVNRQATGEKEKADRVIRDLISQTWSEEDEKKGKVN